MEEQTMASERPPEKIGVLELREMKKEKKPVALVTAYTVSSAQPAKCGGVDIILVGDSGRSVELGYENTNPVTMDQMIRLAQAVRRAASHTFLIGDMPQGSYETSSYDAVRNALRFVKEAGCDAVKCEGGGRMPRHIQAIADSGISVLGHLGLTAQSTASFGGYRVQGKTRRSFEQMIEDAWALEEAGVFAILLEAMPSAAAEQIAFQSDVPVYGIGAGSRVDGQLISMHNLLGDWLPFRPWFAKCFVPEVETAFHQYLSQITDTCKVGRETREDGLWVLRRTAVQRYIEHVRAGKNPGEEYSYPIKPFHQYLSQITDTRKVGRETREDGLRVLRRMAVQRYIEHVRAGKYPGEEHSYPIRPEELEELKSSKYWRDVAQDPRVIHHAASQVDPGLIVSPAAYNRREREVNGGYMKERTRSVNQLTIQSNDSQSLSRA
jgi:3-methyl-2-oxobutanoate hydroxymethyltransferase